MAYELPAGIKENIGLIGECLLESPRYCTGAYPLGPNGGLFYRSGENELGWIDFGSGNVTDAELESLSRACDPATFGLGGEDVLDESYRKAWKMDTSNFSTQFDFVHAGITQVIHDELLCFQSSVRQIEAHLYKLNVYGPGSFFKSHVDTPRSDKMFASLVVILPTKHEGGELILRHKGKEWTFDSASLVLSSKDDEPQAAFVAFYSDMEHEVKTVTAGYRVTLTYNLYYSDSNAVKFPIETVLPPVTVQEEALKSALSSILKTEGFMPDGGFLGFCLSFKYPIDPSNTSFDTVTRHLKGSDALVKRVCESLDLDVSVRAHYILDEDDDNRSILMDHVVDLEGELQSDLEELFVGGGGHQWVHEWGFKNDDDGGNDNQGVPIVWITPLTDMLSCDAPYVAYGNEATLQYMYGKLCLVAYVASSASDMPI